MASKIFNKAVKLSDQDPLPGDIIDRLGELEDKITDPREKHDFLWIYEGVYMRLRDEKK